MVPQPDDAPTLTQGNEETYDQLISLIENTQGRLAPIIVACDDEALRKRVIKRYESEAWQAQIRPYRLVLGKEPRVREGLETLKQQEPHLQRGGKAIFTVTGAEMLLRVKLNPQDEQSELDKFFGYLQWTREGLREFRYPIVLWVTHRILLELSRRSADFWSWRKAVLRFKAESPQIVDSDVIESPLRSVDVFGKGKGIEDASYIKNNSDAELLPPLAELQAEIADLTAKDSDAPGLATLYDRLGQVYARRISQGIAQNLEQEREHTITAFQQAIDRYQSQNNLAAEMHVFSELGYFFESQSCYLEAVANHQKSLDIAKMSSNRYGEANALIGLGLAYKSFGRYSRATYFYQQALVINREISNPYGEADSLFNMGQALAMLGQSWEALQVYQQAKQIFQSLGLEHEVDLCNAAIYQLNQIIPVPNVTKSFAVYSTSSGVTNLPPENRLEGV